MAVEAVELPAAATATGQNHPCKLHSEENPLQLLNAFTNTETTVAVILHVSTSSAVIMVLSSRLTPLLLESCTGDSES